MLYELKGSSADAFLFHMNWYTLRFSIREFVLISGLKCGDENAPKFTFNTEEPNRLLAQYFEGQSKITKRQFVQSFKDKVWGQNDDDAVKFANLYFLHNFIMSEVPSLTKIYRKDFDFAESGHFVDYPWGNKAFGELINNLHSKITLTGKYFGTHGFPLAMQIWLYECCFEVNPDIAKKMSNNIPRILNWETLIDQPWCDYLINDLFRIDRKRLFSGI